MPKGNRGKRKRDYEREIEEAAQRMKKYPERLKSARDSDVWLEFLENIGVNTGILDTARGQDFWEQVRKRVDQPREHRVSKYGEARQLGVPPKLARQVRDWSDKRYDEFIEQWRAKY